MNTSTYLRCYVVTKGVVVVIIFCTYKDIAKNLSHNSYIWTMRFTVVTKEFLDPNLLVWVRLVQLLFCQKLLSGLSWAQDVAESRELEKLRNEFWKQDSASFGYVCKLYISSAINTQTNLKNSAILPKHPTFLKVSWAKKITSIPNSTWISSLESWIRP